MTFAEAAENSVRRILIPLAGGLLALAVLSRGPAQAEPRTYILDPHEGYGVVGCLVDGVACGKVLANAFCESQGRGAAIAFGLASDITASVGGKPAAKAAPGAVIITCAE